jgi:hypothetical protein
MMPRAYIHAGKTKLQKWRVGVYRQEVVGRERERGRLRRGAMRDDGWMRMRRGMVRRRY